MLAFAWWPRYFDCTFFARFMFDTLHDIRFFKDIYCKLETAHTFGRSIFENTYRILQYKMSLVFCNNPRICNFWQNAMSDKNSSDTLAVR